MNQVLVSRSRLKGGQLVEESAHRDNVGRVGCWHLDDLRVGKFSGERVDDLVQELGGARALDKQHRSPRSR
jgi:hypothetical protein